jgi:xylulokinase
MPLVGLDIGTTGCKALVLDMPADGGPVAVIGAASREYPVLTPQPTWAEQDAEAVWRCACEALEEALASWEGDGELAGDLIAALSVQGEAVIPVDAQGNALRPAILGMDTRTAAENRWLAERFDPLALYGRTGMPIHTVNTLPKLLWLQRHEPDVWRAAERFMLYEDFILHKLGASPTISHCLASRTQMIDQRTQDWAHDLLDACDIPVERLSRLAPSGAVCATGSQKSLPEKLKGIRLVTGGHDQACAALGSGVCRPGLAMVSTGTAEVLEVALADPFRPSKGDETTDRLLQRLHAADISVYRHVVDEGKDSLSLAMTLNHSGGLLLRWFRDVFASGESFDDLFSALPQGPTRLMMLPHLAGSGTPLFDVQSKAAILGLTADTSRADVAKALLEGLTFELRLNVDVLREAGIALDTLHAVGGGARNPAWLQLKADLCGVPLRVPDALRSAPSVQGAAAVDMATYTAALGAAILAGVGAGVFDSIPAAVEQVVRFREPAIYPRPEMAQAYEPRYAIYKTLYPTLRDLNVQL